MIFLGQGKIRKVCKWSGKGVGVVNYRFVKSQPQSLFSGKKFLGNGVKIILKKLKTKSRVILIFWGGNFFLEVSAAELINSIEHNYEQQANKTSGKKSCLGSKTKQIRCRLRVYTSSCFLHINLKRSYDIIAYNKTS